MDAYNELEIGTDGYESAYTEVKGDTTSTTDFTGECTDVSTNSADMSIASDTAGGYESTATLLL